MPRRREVPKRTVVPDPIYQSTLASRFINAVMVDGKKSTAEGIFYGAMDILKEKTGAIPSRRSRRRLITSSRLSKSRPAG